jgi:hypothetical protein
MSQSNGSERKKALSIADKYATLFDNDWIKSQRSTIRNKFNDSRTYNPIQSWDGQSDTRKTYRLADFDPPRTKHPIGLDGRVVVPLEESNTLEVLNVPEPNYQATYYPLTSVQQDVGMSSSLKTNIPIKEEARRLNKEVIIDQESGFRHGQLQPPTFKLVDIPKGLAQGGKNCDLKLLSPQQRFEVQVYERRKQLADEYFRQAEQSRGVLYKQLHGPMYKRGITGLDSTMNENSEVYGVTAAQGKQTRTLHQQLEQQRRDRLAAKTSSMTTNGNILVPESIDTEHVKLEKLYQRKGGAVHGPSFDETFNHLFYRIAERPNGDRLRRLRHLDVGGKAYNIITHTAIDLPSLSSSESQALPQFERRENKILSHPSQTSLEGTRNLQGSLRPY